MDKHTERVLIEKCDSPDHMNTDCPLCHYGYRVWQPEDGYMVFKKGKWVDRDVAFKKKDK